MANITKAEFQLKRLTRTMAKTVKDWQSPGGQPSVPDMAESVRGWKEDLERLSIHDELNSRSLQMANRKMAKAWAYRDSRPDAIEAVDEAVQALEDIPAEMSVPEPKTVEEVRNIKSLYGDDIGRYGYEPSVFNDLYEINRQIEGFEAAPSTKHIDYTNLVRVKSALSDVAGRYPQGTRLHSLGHRAVKCLSMAQSTSGRLRDMRKYFSEALDIIGEMGAAADRYHAPTGYKAQLEYGSDDAIEAIEDMQDVMYEQPFYAPQEFLAKAVKAMDRVMAAIEPYYDPKASRLARDVKEHLHLASVNARNSSVKSMGTGAWQYDNIVNPFNEAMNRLSALEAHVKTL